MEHWFSIKELRRELKAITWDGAHRSISLSEYDEYLRRINRHQLAFERLAKIAPLLDDKIPHVHRGDQRDSSDSLSHLFGDIEEFLNHIIDEYEQSRHLAANGDRIRLGELRNYSGALSKRERKSSLYDFVETTRPFRRSTARNVDLVVARLAQALLEPLKVSRV